MHLIKAILLSSLLSIASKSVIGQAAIIAAIFGDKVASERFNLSLELGVPFSQISNMDNIKTRIGINFGIAGNIKLSKNWYLAPTAYFLSSKRIQMESYSLISEDENLNALYQNVKTDMTIKYIDVPVFVHFMPNHSNFKFGLAPQISFRQKAANTFHGDLGDFKQSIKDEINKTDYGMKMSAGYYFKKALNGKGMVVSIRYYQGFSDVLKNNYFDGKNKISHFSFQLSLPFITSDLQQKKLKN
ncbi:MAG: porin family protein [Niabella sp.]